MSVHVFSFDFFKLMKCLKTHASFVFYGLGFSLDFFMEVGGDYNLISL